MKRMIALLILTALLLTGCASAPETPKEQWLSEEGKTCYYNSAGEKVTGWQTIGEKTYYFDTEGTLAAGWQTIDGTRHYLGIDGVPLTGVQTVDGLTYHLDGKGAVLTGYQVLEDAAYILDEDGKPLSDWQCVEDKTYYLDENGAVTTGWQQIGEERYYFAESGVMYTGWKNIDSKTYCFGETGTLHSGWITVNDKTYYLVDGQKITGKQVLGEDTYYFNPDGSMHTGWLEQEEDTYYFLEDGTMAIGQVQIDGVDRFFQENGKHFYLVNPWNHVPEEYKPDIVTSGGRKMDSSCVEPLKQMLKECRDAGHGVKVVSSYRTNAQQTKLHNRMVERYLGYGYGKSEAERRASRISAVPSTSEHQLGLAFDIVDADYTELDYQQADMPTQKWLMKNSWKYGFTLRYPTGKSKVTGIVYEPWHYRYVGVELAKELYDREICLEEYFAELTEQQAAKRAAKQQQ